MSKRVTQLQVKELSDYFKGVDSCVVLSYSGIGAEDATAMRAKLRGKNIRLRIVKNALSRIALAEMGRNALAGLMDGPTAVASGADDAIVLAKAITECVREKEQLSIRGGYCDGQLLSSEAIAAFARIPSREALYAQMLGSINAPLAGVAAMFASIQRSLVTALKAIADQKAEQQA